MKCLVILEEWQDLSLYNQESTIKNGHKNFMTMSLNGISAQIYHHALIILSIFLLIFV